MTLCYNQRAAPLFELNICSYHVLMSKFKRYNGCTICHHFVGDKTCRGDKTAMVTKCAVVTKRAIVTKRVTNRAVVTKRVTVHACLGALRINRTLNQVKKICSLVVVMVTFLVSISGLIIITI